MVKESKRNTFLDAKNSGKIDAKFVPFCSTVSKTKNFFTSSSCSGRIVLLSLDKSESKKEGAFFRKWHRKVKVKEILSAIKSFDGQSLWLKQEPIILHMGTDSLENAKKIFDLCVAAGIKRCGIITFSDEKFIVEVLGSQMTSIPIKDKKFEVSEDYIKFVVPKLNEKFEKNDATLKKLTKLASKFLK
jgi:tRNA wybutosine-synthesizing protein 3